MELSLVRSISFALRSVKAGDESSWLRGQILDNGAASRRDWSPLIGFLIACRWSRRVLQPRSPFELGVRSKPESSQIYLAIYCMRVAVRFAAVDRFTNLSASKFAAIQGSR